MVRSAVGTAFQACQWQERPLPDFNRIIAGPMWPRPSVNVPEFDGREAGPRSGDTSVLLSDWDRRSVDRGTCDCNFERGPKGRLHHGRVCLASLVYRSSLVGSDLLARSFRQSFVNILAVSVTEVKALPLCRRCESGRLPASKRRPAFAIFVGPSSKRLHSKYRNHNKTGEP